MDIVSLNPILSLGTSSLSCLHLHQDTNISLSLVIGTCLEVKRSRTKTHGVASFGDIARTVGANWKKIDDVTLSYVNEVAAILKTRHKQLLDIGGV